MTYVVGAILIVVGSQAGAIVALLVQRARRSRAEQEERFRLLLDRAPS